MAFFGLKNAPLGFRGSGALYGDRAIARKGHNFLVSPYSLNIGGDIFLNLRGKPCKPKRYGQRSNEYK